MMRGDPEEAPAQPLLSPALANAVAIGVTLTCAGVIAYAFSPERAGQPAMLLSLGAFYAVLAAAALYLLHAKGALARSFRPAWGDISLAAVTAGALHVGARIAASALASGASPRILWVRGIYEQLGDPTVLDHTLVGLAVFTVAALEEITWRGLVMGSLQRVARPWRAATITSILYAAAHLPTVALLRVPGVGFNPLLVLAALGCGMVWSALVLRTGRLLPAVLAHALFSWSIIELPLWLQ